MLARSLAACYFSQHLLSSAGAAAAALRLWRSLPSIISLQTARRRSTLPSADPPRRSLPPSKDSATAQQRYLPSGMNQRWPLPSETNPSCPLQPSRRTSLRKPRTSSAPRHRSKSRTFGARLSPRAARLLASRPHPAAVRLVPASAGPRRAFARCPNQGGTAAPRRPLLLALQRSSPLPLIAAVRTAAAGQPRRASPTAPGEDRALARCVRGGCATNVLQPCAITAAAAAAASCCNLITRIWSGCAG
jgi:hypothetical protein